MVETRQVTSDYTFRFQGKIYRIGCANVRPGLRGSNVRIEVRAGGSVHARFQERYLAIEECPTPPRQVGSQATTVSTQRSLATGYLRNFPGGAYTDCVWSQLRRLGLGLPFGRDPIRTRSPYHDFPATLINTGHFYLALTPVAYD